MTLGFSTKINGKPNYFPEKIISGLDIPDYRRMTLMDCLAEVVPHTIEEFLKGSTNPNFPHKPKVHTIREDKNDRWEAGMDIHMVINNRTKDRFQFAPVVKCVSVQAIEIKDVTSTSYPNDFLTKIHLTISKDEWTETFTQAFSVKVDGIQLPQEKVHQLAINDGFDSVEDFFAYFNKDFKGKLIHWTELLY